MILPVIFAATFPVLNVFGFGSALIPLVVIYASLELGDERAPAPGRHLGLAAGPHLLPPARHFGADSLLAFGPDRHPGAQARGSSLGLPTDLRAGRNVRLFCCSITFSSWSETARWYWPLEVWSKITFASLLNLVLSPFFFYLVGLPPRLCGWKPGLRIQERRLCSMTIFASRAGGWACWPSGLCRHGPAPEPALERAGRQFGLGPAAFRGADHRQGAHRPGPRRDLRPQRRARWPKTGPASTSTFTSAICAAITPQSHKGRRARRSSSRPDQGRPQARSEDDIVEIVKESIEPISETLGLTAPLNEKEIREHFRTDPDLPYHYMTDLDFATVANFEERNFGVRGIRIAQNPAREYTYGAFASHILGYVGKPDNQDGAPGQRRHALRDGRPPRHRGDHGRPAPGRAGQHHPARLLPGLLHRGQAARRPVRAPTMGNTLYLTIDARVAVHRRDRHAPRRARTRGAVVVMDPRNGDVLALASVPELRPEQVHPEDQRPRTGTR